jgi:hypothetical protein
MLLASFWLPILVKAVSTAMVVVIASLIAEAIGPFWGALLASLPVSAGPAYLFLAMQHDGDFVAASALSSFAANAATGVFLITYSLLAGRFSAWWSLGVALTIWLIASLAIEPIPWIPATAMLLNLIVYGAGFLLAGSVRPVQPRSGAATIRQWFDLPLRAGIVAVFVSGVTLASSALGPEATGIAAVFPISLTCLIAILQPRIGGPASALLAAMALRAMIGFGLALLTLHLAIRPLGTTLALLAALLVSVSWCAGLLVMKKRSRPSP